MSEAKKTETPKTETQNPFIGAFDPMQMWTQSQQTFQKLVTETYARAQSFADQYSALESQMVARAQSTVAHLAQLTQDAIAYSAQLSAEARKIGFETLRKMQPTNTGVN